MAELDKQQSSGEEGAQHARAAKAPMSASDRRSLIVIIVSAIVIVACVVGVAVILASRKPAGSVVAYGQTDPVPVSKVTRIKPQNAQGKAVTTYVVVLVMPDAPDGSDPALRSFDTSPYRIYVEGNNGFCVPDFADDVVDGDYVACVQEDGDGDGAGDGEVQQLPVRYQRDDASARDEVTVAPPVQQTDAAQPATTESAEPKDPKQVAYALYDAKIEEYVAKYGEPGSETGQFATKLTGLYFARLMDLDGDGVEELVLGYGEPGKVTDEGDTVAALDVWTLKGDTIQQVGTVESALNHSQDATGWIPIAMLDGSPVLFGGKPNVDVQGDVVWYGMVDGELEPKLRLVVEPVPVGEGEREVYPPEVCYFVNGREADETSYLEAEKRVQIVENYATLGYESPSKLYDGTPVHSVQETLQMTMDTIAQLAAAAQPATTEAPATTQASQQAQPVYTSELVQSQQTVTSYSRGDVTNTWSYPQFGIQGADPTDAVKRINTDLKNEFDLNLSDAKAWTPSDGDKQRLWERDSCTSIVGSVASVRLDRYADWGGTLSGQFVSGAFYDLATGEKLTAAQALGMDQGELEQLARDGVRAYLATNPDGARSEDDALSNIQSIIDDGCYYRTDDAIVFCAPKDDVTLNAFGSHDIVIKALSDSVKVGDDIVHRFDA